ncbi:MAG: hypothetical protein Kow0013_20010 [Pararhodobacter sp.]
MSLSLAGAVIFTAPLAVAQKGGNLLANPEFDAAPCHDQWAVRPSDLVNIICSRGGRAPEPLRRAVQSADHRRNPGAVRRAGPFDTLHQRGGANRGQHLSYAASNPGWMIVSPAVLFHLT